VLGSENFASYIVMQQMNKRNEGEGPRLEY